MIKGEYEKLTDVAKTNVCAKCKGPLEVAWYGAAHDWILRCDKCGYPEAVTHNPSLTEEWKQGALPAGPIADNIERQQRKKAAQSVVEPNAITMGGVPAVDLGTGKLVPKDMLMALVQYARKYRLDPTRSHVVLMYGQPYITIDGYLYNADRQGIDCQLRSRPLSSDEKLTYQLEADDMAWTTELLIDGGRRSFTGLGVVTKDEREAKSERDPSKYKSPVVARYPWQLAKKRSEWQALRRGVPIGESED